MFDASRIVILHATLKELRWVNPHVNLLVLGSAKEGDPPTEWLLETTSPGRVVRIGWFRTSLKPGDRVQVEIHPLHDDQEHGGSVQKITSIETGKTFGTKSQGAGQARRGYSARIRYWPVIPKIVNQFMRRIGEF